MKVHHLTLEEAFASLQSGPGGLGDDEAARRLAEFGANRFEAARTESLLLRFIKGFTHFFAVILWIAAAMVLFAEAHQPGQGMATLGWAIVGVIVINGVFSFWQEYRAEHALRALQGLLPTEVKVLRGGAMTLIEAANLVPGDVIVLQEGDSIPADCRVVEAAALRVNNATVTGESLPQSRTADPHLGEEYLHGTNVLLAGTQVVSGEAKALVFATGGHSAFGEIARQTQAVKERLSPLQREIVRLSRIVALLSLGLGVVFYFAGRGSGLSPWENIMFAIGIIVANVPEGLLPTVTLALAMGSQRMARRNALVRHLPAVETLGSATVICTDKTGTLTLNEMRVRRVALQGREIEADDTAAVATASRQCPRFFEVALHCHSLKPTQGPGPAGLRGDPMEIALEALGRLALPGVSPAPMTGQVPFDTARRRMSTAHRAGGRAVLYVKGAPESVLPLCRELVTEHGVVPLDDASRARVLGLQSAMTGEGLRVLMFAARESDGPLAGEAAERDLVLLGLVGLEDPLRPEVPGAMQACHGAGIKVIMITGDHPRTAVSIARQAGMIRGEHPAVVTGEELRRLSNTQLQLALDAPEILFARVTADQKMRIVSALKRKRAIVAVTGDGVNDAPALKKADIGIAMGRSGTDVAREAADIVLLDDNFASIVAAVEEGRAVFANIRKFLTYILTSNIPELVPYVAFMLFKIPLPLTIIQILAVDLGTDMLPALALGAEPPDSGVMKMPPRPARERLIDWRLMARAYLWLGPLQSIAAMAAFFHVLRGHGWSAGFMPGASDAGYLEATTACLSTIILMQIVNVFLCRHPTASVRAGFRARNPLLLPAVALEVLIILAIDYTSLGNAIFGTRPIPLAVWLYAVPFAVVFLLLEEGRKAVARRGRRG